MSDPLNPHTEVAAYLELLSAELEASDPKLPPPPHVAPALRAAYANWLGVPEGEADRLVREYLKDTRP